MGCRGPSYYETDIEVGSNKQAGRVVRMVMGSLTSMVITMAIVMQVPHTLCHLVCLGSFARALLAQLFRNLEVAAWCCADMQHASLCVRL